MIATAVVIAYGFVGGRDCLPASLRGGRSTIFDKETIIRKAKTFVAEVPLGIKLQVLIIFNHCSKKT